MEIPKIKSLKATNQNLGLHASLEEAVLQKSNRGRYSQDNMDNLSELRQWGCII